MPDRIDALIKLTHPQYPAASKSCLISLIRCRMLNPSFVFFVIILLFLLLAEGGDPPAGFLFYSCVRGRSRTEKEPGNFSGVPVSFVVRSGPVPSAKTLASEHRLSSCNFLIALTFLRLCNFLLKACLSWTMQVLQRIGRLSVVGG